MRNAPLPGEPGQRMSIAGPWKWPEHQTLRISTGNRAGHCDGETHAVTRPLQGNVLIRLVEYVLVQGSPSVQMTVRDDADERMWWDGVPREARRGLGPAR